MEMGTRRVSSVSKLNSFSLSPLYRAGQGMVTRNIIEALLSPFSRNEIQLKNRPAESSSKSILKTENPERVL